MNPIGTAFLVFEKQGQQNKAIGDTRPFCAIVMPEDWGSDGVVMLRVSTWRRAVLGAYASRPRPGSGRDHMPPSAGHDDAQAGTETPSLDSPAPAPRVEA